MSKVSIHDTAAFYAYFKEKKQDPNQVRKIRNLFYKRAFTLEAEHKKIPRELMQLARDGIKTNFLSLEKRLDSKVDGASKLLFKTKDGLFIEAVILRIATGRVSLCISSQAGCKFACAFCATGNIGFKRNLTVSEIADQVVQAQQILKEENASLRNVVFMGMGEPLDNFKNVCHTLELLCGSDSFNFGPSNIMVSTCGIADKMIEFAEKFPDINLAVSLHSVSEAHRQEIMPVNRRFDLKQLHSAIEKVSAVSNRAVMLEYLMFKDVNDSEKDATELAVFCQGLNSRINLIAYNQTCADDVFTPVSRDEMFKFKSLLEKAGLVVTIRYSLGEDIEAACGQLASSSS